MEGKMKEFLKEFNTVVYQLKYIRVREDGIPCFDIYYNNEKIGYLDYQFLKKEVHILSINGENQNCGHGKYVISRLLKLSEKIILVSVYAGDKDLEACTSLEIMECQNEEVENGCIGCEHFENQRGRLGFYNKCGVVVKLDESNFLLKRHT